MNVYVLSNPAMPGLVKIGRAAVVESRVEDLSRATGVPLPFTVEHIEEVDDPVVVEFLAHAALAVKRVNIKREFFSATVDEAIAAIQYAALVSAWNKAGESARQRFRELIDTPVMDRRFSA